MKALSILFLVFLCAAFANAAPIPTSSCVNNPVGVAGFTCNAFESDAEGLPAEVSNTFTLPNGVTAGFIILMDLPGLDQTNRANWSDVLRFNDNGQGSATTATLLSRGCNTVNPADVSCFPTFAQVNAAASAFITESAAGPTVYFADPNTYNIFSNPDGGGSVAPEPASLALFGGGLGGLLFAAWRRRKVTQ